VLPRLNKQGLSCGQDFFLAYSPEREDPGNKHFSTSTIPKLVAGVDEQSGKLAFSLYSKIVSQAVLVSSAEVAEASKLLENIYRAVNIALVNEMKVILTEMGINVWEVIEAASTKPFGFQPFFPGPGLGGHCIPIDPYYLTWKAREIGLSSRFIELSGEINRAMPHYVLKRTVEAMNQYGKAVKESRLLILGLAYKPDIDDVRESPGFILIELLKEMGARVDYHDPYVKRTKKTRHFDLKMASITLSAEALQRYDCVIVATNHSLYDWQFIAHNARLIVDTRNALKDIKDRSHIFLS
jgi:UDP-N-acetyl-D-glucosamine dehydrogenase